MRNPSLFLLPSNILVFVFILNSSFDAGIQSKTIFMNEIDYLLTKIGNYLYSETCGIVFLHLM